VSNVDTLRYQDNSDENLFVDDAGTGNLVYTTIASDHAISIERLTPDFDFLGADGESSSSGPIGVPNTEAPAAFKQGGIFNVAFDFCCCCCGSVSEVTVHSAPSPLGPYAAVSTLGLDYSGNRTATHQPLTLGPVPGHG